MTPSEKANQLLIKHLSPDQRETWYAHRWIYVLGQITKERYKIFAPGPSWAVVLTKDFNYCAYTLDLSYKVTFYGSYVPIESEHIPVPIEDDVLVKKLLIENDEGEFLRIAVRSWRNKYYDYDF